MSVDVTAATDAAALEITRFEWAKPDRIELVGVWSGLRGRRFMRPTLVLEREGEQIRLLALLEHKPWQADDGEQWIAAFAWDGAPVKFRSADLNVATGIDVKLPPPRMRPGKPRRFPHRAVSRDGSRENDAATQASGPGIVTEPVTPKRARRAGIDPAPEAAPKQEPKPAATAAKAAPASTEKPPGPVPTEQASAPTAVASAPAADGSLRTELDRARSERDAAREELRALRRQLEEERQSRERAVADARASERASAQATLAEGVELRAAVERQRQLAYEARDQANADRDKAIAARERATSERDDAVAARRQAERDRQAAFRERDQARKQSERDLAARDKALAERDRAIVERDAAHNERDTIVSVHERGLPVVPPKPRFLPERRDDVSDLELWAPRAAALAFLVVFAFIVLRLLAG